MSPKEAAEITEEPDWLALWDALKVADDGYEVLLLKWRRWHWTPGIEYRDNHGDMRVQKNLAPSVDGVIALANLGIFPRLTDRPPGLFEDQHDDHMWLVTEGRAWRVVGIEDMTLHLDSFGEPRQIDLSKAKWDKYCEGHEKRLAAMP